MTFMGKGEILKQVGGAMALVMAIVFGLVA